jgi:hypothetical protein
VGIVLSATSTTSSSGLTAVLTVLRTDTGIQELAPYLSRTFYQQVRANGKRLVLLSSIVRYAFVPGCIEKVLVLYTPSSANYAKKARADLADIPLMCTPPY